MTTFLAVTLVLAPATIVVADGLGPIYTIPAPEPGVENDYQDTYRVLANNDADVDPASITYDGYFQNDYPYGPTVLNARSQSPSQTLRYAGTQDLYIREVSSFNAIPYRDEWLRYSDANSYQKTQFLLVHGNNTYDGPTSVDGKWFVRITNQYGEWRPVYNADVRWDPAQEEHYVVNPDEALIHDAEYGNTIDRNLHAAGQYMRYAQDSERVAVPMMNGRELYPTSSGASMPRKWGQSDFDTVRDSWVGINHVFGSVWYRGSYVSGGAPTRGAYVPYDHRAVAPPDYSYVDQCRINHIHRRTHTHDNSTHTHTSTHWHYHDRTKWVEYDILSSSAEVMSVRLDAPGFDGDSEWNQFGPETWIAIDDPSSRPLEYPRGEYTLTATLEVTTEAKTRWGITSSRCSEWTQSSTDSYTHTTSYSVPVTITDYDSPNLNVTVAHIDGAGDDRLILKWDGDQDLPADPWTQIRLDINGKTIYVDSPWRFYGIARNDEVEVRTLSSSSTYDVTHTHNDRWPAIYHYETSVANVTMAFPQRNAEYQRWGWITTVDSQVTARLAGEPLPAGVNDPDNDAPTELYRQHVVTVNSNDLDTGETVQVTGVGNPYGANLDDAQIEAYSKPYAQTVLRLMETTRSPTGEDHEGTLILTNTSDGFLEGKAITVVQGDGTRWTVTTDAEGRAPITWDGMTVRAYYEGDVWDTGPDDPYYKGDSIIYMLPPGEVTFSPIGTVGAYISAAIDDTLIFVEWIALGIFALWYVRMRRRTSKHGGGKKA
ncbi:hypothetical protein [Haloglomus halophilum]|uniref:hypothetical protein n=1 Tax=Haloglomus halophilum TaxID=2962672 RepID=UPI0020C95317|nr:hypothetical protein [Haloglomus halophilum]